MHGWLNRGGKKRKRKKKSFEEKDVCPLLFYFLPFKEAIVSLLAYRSCTYTLYNIYTCCWIFVFFYQVKVRSIFHSYKKKKEEFQAIRDGQGKRERKIINKLHFRFKTKRFLGRPKWNKTIWIRRGTLTLLNRKIK